MGESITLKVDAGRLGGRAWAALIGALDADEAIRLVAPRLAEPDAFDAGWVKAFTAKMEEGGEASAPALARWLAPDSPWRSSPNGRWALAEILQQQGRREEAHQWWGTVAEGCDAESRAEAWLARARLGRDLGRVQEALDDLRRAAGSSSDFNFLTRAARFHERLTAKAPLAARRTVRIALLYSTTAELLAPLLRLACFREGLRAEIYVAPFGSYRQEILDPQSELYRFGPDFVVLGLHWRDAHVAEFSAEPEAQVERVTEELTSLWRQLRERIKGTVIQHDFDLPADDSAGYLGRTNPQGRAQVLQAINRRLFDKRITGVEVLPFDQIAAEFGLARWEEPALWHLAKQHPSPAALPLLVDHYVALIRASLGLAKKVLVLDLDNTLWGGVIGEDGLAGIKIGPPSAGGEAHAALQGYALALKQRGILLAVCSKNNDADARLPFRQHEGMVLKEDDFAVFMANWADKPANLREIARQLNLGLDSLVFLDDNPVERARVARELPEVAVVEAGRDPADLVRALHRGLYFEALALTQEDRARAAGYRANLLRAELQAGTANLDEFLRRLAMKVHRGAFSDHVFDRVVQLLGKTNQFNLTTRRHSAGTVREFMRDGRGWTQHFRLTDCYGDNGIIGLIIARESTGDRDEWVVDTFLMSCRVIGRRMEDYMVSVLLQAAKAAGCSQVRGLYVPTAKNGLVADLYPRVGFREDPGYRGEGKAYVWDLRTRDIPVVPFFEERGE